MAQNNIWYSFVEMMSDPEVSNSPAGLRMNAIATSGGTEKTKFEGYSLAASIIGKYTKEFFNDSFVIIDEVHNFISQVVNGSKFARNLYTKIMDATNIKLVLLFFC